MIKEFKISHERMKQTPVLFGVPEELQNQISKTDYDQIKMLEYCMQQIFCKNDTYNLMHIDQDGKMYNDTYPHYDILRVFLHSESKVVVDYTVACLNYIDDQFIEDQTAASYIYMEWRYGTDWRNKQDDWDIKKEDIERLLKILNR